MTTAPSPVSRRAGFTSIWNYRANNMEAVRVWWMLRAFGFDNVADYDGSMSEWGDDPNMPIELD